MQHGKKLTYLVGLSTGLLVAIGLSGAPAHAATPATHIQPVITGGWGDWNNGCDGGTWDNANWGGNWGNDWGNNGWGGGCGNNGWGTWNVGNWGGGNWGGWGWGHHHRRWHHHGCDDD